VPEQLRTEFPFSLKNVRGTARPLRTGDDLSQFSEAAKKGFGDEASERGVGIAKAKPIPAATRSLGAARICCSAARARGRGKVLSPFLNWRARWPNRTRHLGRIGHLGRVGIIFGRGLPRQTCELATSANPDKSPAGSKGSRLFFVEDVESRQADVEDFVFTKDNFVAHTSHRIERRH
jgi:hypothetical protein